MNERDIFTTAREKTDPQARSAFLAEACGEDAALRNRVEQLLRADESPDTLLDAPPNGWVDANPADTDKLDFLEPSTRPGSLGRLGHYEVLEILGRGGFGIVFRAFDETLQRVVAVKVLAPEMAAGSPARKRFLREARSSAQVRHDNVVQVHGVEEQPLPYLVMEFVAGETLEQRIERTGPLATSEVVRIGRQIAAGLAAAHATGLIHRDIKPANVLIERGPNSQVKLTDFGLARAADDASLTQSGFVAGTPMYMSPEQARGERLDQRSDLFSLGSVLYVMLTGRPPFRAEHPLAVLRRVNEDIPRPIPEIIPEAPPWLCDLIAKLHAKNPDDRYPSAREVIDALTDGETLPTQSGISFAPPRTSPPIGGWRWTVVMVVVLPLIVLGVYALPRPIPPSEPSLSPVVPLRQPASDPVGDPDRQAVLWLRSLGPIQIDLIDGDPPTPRRITADQPLPEGPFRLVYVEFRGMKVNNLGDDLVDKLAVHLKGVRLTGAHLPQTESFTTAGLAKLVELPTFADVSYLGIGSCGVDDGMFAHLAKLPKLTNLDAGPLPNVTGKGIGALQACSHLAHLTLIATPLTAEGLEEVQQLPALQYLNISESRCTEQHITALAKLKVNTLIAGSSGINDVMAARLAGLEATTSLSVAGNPLTDKGLVEFKKLSGLKSLDVGATQVTADGVAELQKALPDCKITWK